MKICATQGLFAVLICGVSIAFDNHGQVLDREISITVSDVSFDLALIQIANAAHVKFAYSPELLNVKDPVSLNVENMTVREILNNLLLPKQISYVMQRDGVTISLKRIPKQKITLNNTDSLSETDRSLNATLTGTVIDVASQPIAGVNVVIKGSTIGTTTDASGRFSIEVDKKDILVFSFIGYAPKEVQVGNQTNIEVILLEDIQSLGEVVVNAGYWEVTEKQQTGNISKISAKEIQNQPVSNPLQALQGRMPGIYIQQSTGIPGGAFNIKIRGRNSLRTDGNDPLYIIDGVPFTTTSLASPTTSSIIQGGNPFASISPNDIESIEVLKDADATAIYGSRGSNGVVLITTKKGQKGKVQVEFNLSSGVGHVPSFMDLLSTSQYLEMRKEAFRNDGNWPIPASLQYAAVDLYEYDSLRYTDWQEALMGGSASTNMATVSISGGSKNTQFLFGGTYYKEGTVFPGDFGFKRGSANLNVSHTTDDNRFHVSVSMNYSSSVNNLFAGDMTRLAVTLSPNAPAMYDSRGGINWNWKNPFLQNPLISLERKYTTSTDNLIANSTLSYQLWKGLQIRTHLGYTTMQINEISLSPLSAINPAALSGQTGSTIFADGEIKTWIAEPQLDYSQSFGGGIFKVLMGASFQESIQGGETLRATGYTSDALLENIRAATAITISNATHSQYRYMAFFGRINYTWREKYIINLTGRRDGSSRFGPGKRFGNFGAVGIAWIFSQENFLKDNLDFLSFGKVRMSYGSTGSDAIGNYQYLNTFSSTTYPYNGSTGLTVTRLYNPDYSWESNNKFEIGLELGLLDDKIQLSTSWFNNRSSNQLVGLPLPVLTGQSSVQFNLPATVENKGWEFQLNTVNLSKAKFRWSTNLNITIPKNTLIEFPNLEAFPAYSNTYKLGESLFLKRTLKMEGVNRETGLYTFSDVNADGSISTANDGQFLKRTDQVAFGGLNNSVSFFGFDLDFMFQFVKQDGYNYLSSFQSPGNMSNQPSIVVNRWRQPGDNATIQRYALLGQGNAAYVNNLSSDNAISDASFVRLKNISLTWNIPHEWIKKWGIEKCRIYLQGQNLFTWTNYIGLDPETQNSAALPPLRTLMIGLNFTL